MLHLVSKLQLLVCFACHARLHTRGKEDWTPLTGEAALHRMVTKYMIFALTCKSHENCDPWPRYENEETECSFVIELSLPVTTGDDLHIFCLRKEYCMHVYYSRIELDRYVTSLQVFHMVVCLGC
jgi:hypothetical protein